MRSTDEISFTPATLAGLSLQISTSLERRYSLLRCSCRAQPSLTSPLIKTHQVSNIAKSLLFIYLSPWLYILLHFLLFLWDVNKHCIQPLRNPEICCHCSSWKLKERGINTVLSAETWRVSTNRILHRQLYEAHIKLHNFGARHRLPHTTVSAKQGSWVAFAFFLKQNGLAHESQQETSAPTPQIKPKKPKARQQNQKGQLCPQTTFFILTFLLLLSFSLTRYFRSVSLL